MGGTASRRSVHLPTVCRYGMGERRRALEVVLRGRDLAGLKTQVQTRLTLNPDQPRNVFSLRHSSGKE